MNEPLPGPSGRPDSRYDLIDVWRGVACLMVVLHHAGFAVVNAQVEQGGLDGWLRRAVIAVLWRMNLGVPLFFVISGYCIGAAADSARARGWNSLRFFGRRFRRIYPPYWASLLFFAGVTAGLDAVGLERLRYGSGAYALQLDPPGKLDRVQWLGNITLTEEWRPLVWRPPYRDVYTRVAWSLCYEEQFYFLCFLMLFVARRRLYGAWLVLTVVAYAVRAVWIDTGRFDYIQGSFFLLWHEFAFGLAVYWVLNAEPSLRGRRAVGLALAAFAVVGLLSGPGSTPVAYSTPTAAAFALLLIALRPRDEPAKRLAWLAPLRACGRRCYSIYLVHLPVCTVGNLTLAEFGLTGFWARVLVMIPVVSCAAVGVSWAFFHGVERHFLNAPPGRAGRKPPRAPVRLEPVPQDVR
jgi:peptidoglycan/LPS O-acetylase OafA/YrhL